MSDKLYECENPACSLGAVGQPGQFTGGATAEFINLLKGTPIDDLVEGADYGEGFCPNCAVKGTEVGTHESLVATDEEA